MAMTVLITLTTAGIDSGPFNLYSNTDGYLSAFASGIGRASLLAGYSSSVVPDGTTTIRLISTGNCTNYTDLLVNATTTTTTSGLTTTTTTGLTTTSTTAIVYNLSVGDPSCRLNNCGDNSICAVRYNISVDLAPVGSYLTITQNSGTATVVIYNASPVAGMLEYSEVNALGTANFTIFLRDSGGSILTSITSTISHQSFWQFLSICIPCDEYTIGGTNVGSATFIDCNGVELIATYDGPGVSGYDQSSFCARSIVSYTGNAPVLNRPCPS